MKKLDPNDKPIDLLNAVKAEMFVEKLMLDDMSVDQIILVAKEKLKVGESNIRKTMRAVKARWEQDMAEKRHYWKMMAIRRLMNTIQSARSADPPNYSAVLGAERLLSQIQGTQAPIEIRAEFEYSEAVASYIGNLTNDDLQAMIMRYDELQRTHVINTQGETVGGRSATLPPHDPTN